MPDRNAAADRHESRDVPTLSSACSERSRQILKHALTVFAEEGFAQADVQAIADRSGVGKGTVYRQFGNKEALFLAAARFAREWMMCEVDRRALAEADPLARLRACMLACLQFCDEHPEVVEMLVQERALFRGRTLTFFDRPSDEVNLWNDRLRELVQLGVFRDLPIEQIDDAISKFVLGTMFVNFFAGKKKPLNEQYEGAVDILFHGLLTSGDAAAAERTERPPGSSLPD